MARKELRRLNISRILINISTLVPFNMNFTVSIIPPCTASEHCLCRTDPCSVHHQSQYFAHHASCSASSNLLSLSRPLLSAPSNLQLSTVPGQFICFFTLSILSMFLTSSATNTASKGPTNLFEFAFLCNPLYFFRCIYTPLLSVLLCFIQ